MSLVFPLLVNSVLGRAHFFWQNGFLFAMMVLYFFCLHECREVYMAHPTELNKAVEDAITTLTKLDQAITMSYGSDVDYRPNETTQKAFNAVEKLNSMLQTEKEGVKELRGRGNVLDVMAKIGPKLDSPSIQTMLGSVAVELSGMLRNVQQVLKEKDTKKVEGTGFEGLKKRGS